MLGFVLFRESEVPLTSLMRFGPHFGEMLFAIKEALSLHTSPGSGSWVRVPRNRWMRLFPWLRLYYCPQRKLTKLHSRAKVDLAREEIAMQKPERFRRPALKACAQPSLEAPSADNGRAASIAKNICAEAENVNLEGLEKTKPKGPSTQRPAIRNPRPSVLLERNPRPGNEPCESKALSADGRITVVVRVELNDRSMQTSAEGSTAKPKIDRRKANKIQKKKTSLMSRRVGGQYKKQVHAEAELRPY